MRSRTWIIAGMTAGLLVGCARDVRDDASDESEWIAPSSGSQEVSNEGERRLESPTRQFAPEPSLDPVAVEPDTEESDERGPGEEGEFVVHEWGTFTSVVDSEGNYREGLHHEEESLPAFVHRLGYDGIGPGRLLKGMPYLPEPVTQKLETPVLYFYSETDREVEVTVEFPDGYISEWYPDAADFSPSGLDRCCNSSDEAEQRGLDRLADGSMTWEATVTDEPQDPVDVAPDDVWAPSREVPDASWVTHGDEAEKFVFYRGIGRFEPPLSLDVEPRGSTNTIRVDNESEETIGNVYLLDVHEERGRILELGEVEADSERRFMPAPKEAPVPIDHLVDEAKTTVASGLVETGLTEDEAEAMVETWARSYFAEPGYRLLYVLPPEWTDRLLPTEIEPTPDEFLRVLVGRVEMLTPKVEAQTVERLEEAYRDGRSLTHISQSDRFEEPRFRRACELVEDDEIENWCHTQVRRMSREVLRVESH